jgi:uncharacterized integral membrane protein
LRIIGWIIGLPALLVVAIFAVANRQPLTLELWPLPWSVEVPLYLAVLGPLVLGLLIGLLAGWSSGLRSRRHARSERRRADSLARELEQARPPAAPPE